MTADDARKRTKHFRSREDITRVETWKQEKSLNGGKQETRWLEVIISEENNQKWRQVDS